MGFLVLEELRKHTVRRTVLSKASVGKVLVKFNEGALLRINRGHALWTMEITTARTAQWSGLDGNREVEKMRCCSKNRALYTGRYKGKATGHPTWDQIFYVPK